MHQTIDTEALARRVEFCKICIKCLESALKGLDSSIEDMKLTLERVEVSIHHINLEIESNTSVKDE